MKSILALMILMIGLVVVWPPGEQVRAATSDQVSFVVDHQAVVPMAAMLQDNYTFDQIGNVMYQNVDVCREGGGVVILNVIYSDQRHLYLCEKPIYVNIKFTQYARLDFRICTSISRVRNQNIQKYNGVSGQIHIRSDTQIS